ncbi:hypothetical protein RHMOL_Rhmol09G0119100 [Rhododendron molle]|uniref:Uncharacterized protein n=1 Tax=Rhododendron molle TaxID=49168 RepID=A0ACC0MDH7_RHOML|nr:hypothetical protein RHMOL_Rhmol09G0119100 [Rhododendron molle]
MISSPEAAKLVTRAHLFKPTFPASEERRGCSENRQIEELYSACSSFFHREIQKQSCRFESPYSLSLKRIVERRPPPPPNGHKDAKQFKSKGLDHYDLLVELCEGTLATGAFAGYPSTLGSPHSRGAMEKLDSSDVVWNFLQKQISKVLTWSSVLPVCWYYLCCCVQPLLSVDCAVVWPITLLLQQLLLHAVKQQFCGCCFLMPPFEAAAL